MIGQVWPMIVLSRPILIERGVGYKRPIAFGYSRDFLYDLEGICGEVVLSTKPYDHTAGSVEDVGHPSYLRVSFQHVLLIHAESVNPVVGRNSWHEWHVNRIGQHAKCISKVARDFHQAVIADDMVSTRSTNRLCVVFQI